MIAGRALPQIRLFQRETAFAPQSARIFAVASDYSPVITTKARIGYFREWLKPRNRIAEGSATKVQARSGMPERP